MNEVVQSPEQVGTLWKTLSARIRGAKTELIELGEEEDKFTKSTSNLRELVKSMTGFDIMKDENTYKDLYEIIMGIGQAWSELSDIQQASLGEALSGKRNANAFYAVMGNLDTLKAAYETAENAAGSAEREQENYAKSVQYSLDRVKAAAQELAYDFLSSDFLKGAIEAFARFIEVLDKVVEATHGVVPAVTAAAGAFYAFSTINGLMKTLGAGMKMLQKATDTETKSTTLNTLAKIKQAISEKLLAKAKKDTTKASMESAAAQKAETSAQQADIATNGSQALSEAAKNYKAAPGKSLQYFGERPATPVLEGAGGAAGLFGIEGLTAGMVTAAAAIAAVVAGLAVVGGTMAAISERNKELQQSASELGNKYKESANDIDGYKERIEALREIIDSSSTSYEEAKEARQELLGIQSELIEKYGGEEGSIRLVTDAINGQVDALDRLKDRQWEQTKNDYNATKGSGWTDYWNHVTTGTSDNIELLQKKMYDSNIAIGGFSFDERDFLKKMNEILGGEFTADISGANPESTLVFSGQLDEVLDKLYKVQELSKDFDLDDSFKQSLTDLIKSTQDEYNNYLPMADQLVLNDSIRVNFENELKQMESAYDNYQEAILNKDNETAEQAKQNMVNVINSLEDADVTPEVLKYFRSKLFPDIQADLGKWELAADLELTPVMDSEVEVDIEQDSSSQALADLLSDLQQFSSENDLMNFNAATALDTQSEAYSRLSATAKLYGLEISDLISLLREMGALSSLDRDNNGYMARGIEKARGANYGAGRLGIDNAEKQNRALYDAFNRLSDEDYEIASTFGATQYKEIATAMNEAADASGEVVVQGKALDEILAAMISKTKEEKGLLEETAESLSVSDQLSEIQSLTEGLDKLKKVYEDVANGEEFDWSSILNNEDFKKAFTEFEGATEQSVKAYEDFINTVSNNPADIGATQEAFNNLVTSYIEETGSLENVTQATRDRTVALLEGMGVTNATAMVEQALADAEARLWLEEQNVANVTPEVIAQLFNEGVEAGNTEAAMLSLIAEMNIFSNTSLSIADKVAALQELAAQAGITASAMSGALGSGSAGAGIQAGRARVFGKDQAAKMLKDEWSQAIKDYRKTVEYKAPPSDTGKKTGGGGGGSKDAEKEKDILAELSKQLDEIQAAYSSLSGIVEKYNETGKLTIDEAQELINTDFRYLAMLKQENGQLVLNEEGLQNMAKAKLQEMQIQLARNAIDTVNGLKTEADAVNFLKYAYEGLAGATLDATEAQLQYAVAAAKANGGYRAEAAQKIWEGYQATKVAIGNIDLGSDSLAGKKDSDKDKDKSDKDKSKSETEKDTKTKFNWLDKLVEQIQRSIDKLARRAEKYFTYTAKNALVNKQITANQRMINTQEFAVDYYSRQAAKALKKVPKKYRDLVSGDFDPTTVKKIVAEVGEGKTKKLEEYIDWQQSLEKAEDALEDAYAQERDLIASKLTNILEYFDTLIETQNAVIDRLDASNRLAEAKGESKSLQTMLNEFSKYKEIVDLAAQREKDYKAEYENNRKEIEQSYADQIEDVKNQYQSTKDYTEFEKAYNKGKNNWKSAAYEWLRTHPIDVEDMATFKEYFKKYYKDQKKNNLRVIGGKTIEQRLEELSSNFVNGGDVADLVKEQKEVLEKAENDYQRQIEENRTATEEASINIWETLKAIFDEMASVFDRQIQKASALVQKYDNINTLLDSNNKKLTKYYGVDSIASGTESDLVRKSVEQIGRQIELNQEKYNFYSDLYNAGGLIDKDAQKEAFEKILKTYGLQGADAEKIQEVIDTLANNKTWTTSDQYMAEWQENMVSISNEILSNFEALRSYVKKATDELVETFSLTQKRLQQQHDRWSSLADFATQYSDKDGTLKKYGLLDIYGLVENNPSRKVNWISNAIDDNEQLMESYKKEIELLLSLRKAYLNSRNEVDLKEQIGEIIDNSSDLTREQRQKLLDYYNNAQSITKETFNEWTDTWITARENYLKEAKTAEDNWAKIFSTITETIEEQSKVLSRAVTKYTSVYDLLNSLGSSVYEKYDLGAVSDPSHLIKNALNEYLQQSINSVSQEMKSNKTNYQLYTQLAQAANTKDQSLFYRISTSVQDANMRAAIREIISDLVANPDIDLSKRAEEWANNANTYLTAFLEDIKKLESYTDEIIKKIKEASDESIKGLTRVVNKYENVVKLYEDHNKSIIQKYGVTSVFGNTSEQAAISQILQTNQKKIHTYRKQYGYNSSLIDILKNADNRKQALKTYLNENGKYLGDELRSNLEALLNANVNLDSSSFDATKYIHDLEDARNDIRDQISSLISESESYIDRIVTKIKEASDETIKNLTRVANKYENVAKLLGDYNSNVIKKYSVSNVFGSSSELSAISKVLKNNQQQIDTYRRQYNVNSSLIDILNNPTNRTQALSDYLKKNSKYLGDELRSNLEALLNANVNLDSSSFDATKYIHDLEDAQSSIRDQIVSLISESENYGDQIVTAVKKTTQKVIDQFDETQQVLNAKLSVINDDWVIDVNGITEFGRAKINVLSDELENAQKILKEQKQQISDLEANRNQMDKDKYDTAMKESWTKYYQALSEVYNYEKEIVDIADQIAQAEIDRVSELVDNYKKALNAKKEYYDYDKTLKEKNKNIQSLESQIAALENLSDAASKARLKSLHAELEEAQQDLDDTVFEHSISVESDALDKLVDDMSEVLDKSNKTIEEILKDFLDGLNTAFAVGGEVSTNSVYRKLTDLVTNPYRMETSTADEPMILGSSSVSDDIASGLYSPLSVASSYNSINQGVVNILSSTSQLVNSSNKISSKMDYLPNIFNNVAKISTDTFAISRNTARILEQIRDIHDYTLDSTKLLSKIGANRDGGFSYQQLKQLGLKRTY